MKTPRVNDEDGWDRMEEDMSKLRCASCDGKQDAGMRERLANGDDEICEPCYEVEYKL